MKPFKTIDEQIALLKSRGLVFKNEEVAKVNLLSFGYYEIVNGYKDILLEEGDTFQDGETFEHLLRLYYFDKSIKYAVLLATLEVELLLRTALAYSIAETYGSDESEYLIRKNYRQGKKYRGNRGQTFYTIDKMFSKFDKIKNDNTQPYRHYRETHNNIPPWILLKGATFGNLIHFLKIQKGAVKDKVYCILSGLRVEIISDRNTGMKNLLQNVLDLSHQFRNRAAHGGRMYNFRAKNCFVQYNKDFHKLMMINEEEHKQGQGTGDIFTLLTALKFLHNVTQQEILLETIMRAIGDHIDLYPNDFEPMMNAMGIPTVIYDAYLGIYDREARG